MLFSKQHQASMHVNTNNTLIRTNSASSKNSDCKFGNCDWYNISYCRMGAFLAVDTPLIINTKYPPVALPFNNKLAGIFKVLFMVQITHNLNGTCV